MGTRVLVLVCVLITVFLITGSLARAQQQAKVPRGCTLPGAIILVRIVQY
jgi:hypothetical protein